MPEKERSCLTAFQQSKTLKTLPRKISKFGSKKWVWLNFNFSWKVSLTELIWLWPVNRLMGWVCRPKDLLLPLSVVKTQTYLFLCVHVVTLLLCLPNKVTERVHSFECDMGGTDWPPEPLAQPCCCHCGQDPLPPPATSASVSENLFWNNTQAA